MPVAAPGMTTVRGCSTVDNKVVLLKLMSAGMGEIRPVVWVSAS